MRVVHVTYQHTSDDARILHKQCRSLAEAGLDTHLIAPLPKPPNDFGVIFHALDPKITDNKIQRLRAWMKQIQDIIARLRPDIVHLHDPLLLRIAPAIRRRSDARLVYDAHEDHARQIRALTHLAWPRRHLQANYYGRLERRAPKHIDGFVAATPGIAKLYPSERTITVRNLPRLAEFNAPHTPVTGASFVYVGGLTRSRGLIEMLDAIARVPNENAKLILAGRFDCDDTKRLAESHTGWTRVDFRGWLDHAKIPAVLNEAVVGLVVLHPMPNYIDAWPVKLFEYMAAGLPFIASDFQPWRNMLDDKPCGCFVDPLNPDDIAQAMNRILAKPEKAAAHGRAGRTLIEHDFNWEQEASVLINGYEALLTRT